MASEQSYYVPESTRWPVIASIALFTMVVGGVNWLHVHWSGPYILLAGSLLMTIVFFGWFGNVIQESEAGLYDAQVDRSFRWGMIWFIISEIFFFAAFFGALFYMRYWSVPMLGGEVHPISHLILWPDFIATWPLFVNPDNQLFVGPAAIIDTWHLPALNTLILLISGITITWAHWALKLNKRKQLVWGLIATVALGCLFLFFQAMEYIEAYEDLGLTMASGAYGATFFMLTGFHGLHVTMGTIMLIVITLRAMKGHFTPEDHFGFEGVAWYWHFVDVVWLFLFIFVYWL